VGVVTLTGVVARIAIEGEFQFAQVKRFMRSRWLDTIVKKRKPVFFVLSFVRPLLGLGLFIRYHF
jgi:hypothetical protein